MCGALRQPLDITQPNGQYGLGAVESLNLALFIDAEHQSVIGWMQIQADNVAHLLDKEPEGRHMAREPRPNCQCCDRDLPASSNAARICSYECTFCAGCVDTVLRNVCPTCGGGFTIRPVRPVTEWRSGLSLARRPPSTRRVHLSYDLKAVAAFSDRVCHIAPEAR